jgi:hypothetical protein
MRSIFSTTHFTRCSVQPRFLGILQKTVIPYHEGNISAFHSGTWLRQCRLLFLLGSEDLDQPCEAFDEMKTVEAWVVAAGVFFFPLLVLLPESKSLLLVSHITTTDTSVDLLFWGAKKTRQHNKKYALGLKKKG